MSTLSHKSQELQAEGPQSGDAAQDWHHHEHIADAARAHAKQLVDELGSVDLARHAIEAASAEPTAESNQSERQQQLCQSLGVRDMQELMERSSPVESNDGKQWFVTETADNRWVVWREEEYRVDRHFASREEALANVPHHDDFTGSSLLG